MLTKINLFSVFTVIVLSLQTTISAMDNHDNRDKFLTLTILANYLNQRAIVPVINQLNSKKNESNSFWRSLQQLFSKNNLQDIKTDLNLLLVSLKNDDSINKSFNNEDVAKCKQLWDEFLLLHNYSFLDQIIYPHHPHIESPEAKKYKKTE